MKKKLIAVCVLAVICTVGIILAVNGREYNPFIENDEEEVEYTESLTVNLPMEKVRTLNPIISKDADTYQISRLIFESLFVFDEKLQPQKQLAESYVYNAEDKTADITIKRNSYFSDGTNVTAEDVKYSIDSYIAAGTNSIYYSYVSNIKSVSLNKENAYALTVKFKTSSNVSEDNFTFPILSKKNFGKYSAERVTKTDFIPIGSGPYAVESYNEISELVLSANGHYSGEKPKNTLCFTILPEKEDVIPLIEVNSMSLGILESLSRDTLIADKKVKSENFISNQVEVMGFNFSREAIQNKKVRKAIAYAIDNKALIESVYYKNGVECDTIFYPNYLGTQNTGDNYEYSMEKAKDMLVSANYIDRDENGYLEDADGKELEINILVNGQDANRAAAAENIKANLDKLHIAGTIIYASDAEDFISRLYGKNYDVFLGELKINETYDLRSLLHTDYGNVIGYSNQKADKLMDKLKSGISAEKQVQTVEQLKEILIDEIPYYCIAYKTFGALTSESFCGNEKGYMFNNFYKNCQDWYCRYAVEKTQEQEIPDPENVEAEEQ